MLGRFSKFLNHAVEALAPAQSSLDDFEFHWRATTGYFLENRDAKAPLHETSIPGHLNSMLNLLCDEESRFLDSSSSSSPPSPAPISGTATGPCMEYLLQHNILETLRALGTADCPTGMRQQMLDFFAKLLGRVRQPILPHVNVHRPVRLLVKTCGKCRAGPHETEEISFLRTIASKLKRDPYLVDFFLEDAKVAAEKAVEEEEGEGGSKEYALAAALVALTDSPDAEVAIKASEGLLLISSLPEPRASSALVANTSFAASLTERLVRSYRAIPVELEPVLELLSSGSEIHWGLRWEAENAEAFPGKRRLVSFLSWFDYLDQLVNDADSVAADSLADEIKSRFLEDVLETDLLTEVSASSVPFSSSRHHLSLFATALLTRCLTMIRSRRLLDAAVAFLLGVNAEPEPQAGDAEPHVLRSRLLGRCGRDDDAALAAASLRLFEVLLSRPHPFVHRNLLLRNLEGRRYLDEERRHDADGRRRPPNGLDKELAEFLESLDLLSVGDEDAAAAAAAPSHRTVAWLLNIVPANAKGGEGGDGGGFEVYLLEAHRQLSAFAEDFAVCDWPKSPVAVAEFPAPPPLPVFFEGSFLRMLLRRLDRLLSGKQSYELNLQVTALVSLVASLPHPNLNEFWLSAPDEEEEEDPEGALTLYRVLRRLGRKLDRLADADASFGAAVAERKRRLQVGDVDDNDNNVDERRGILEGAVLLDELCKELASIVLVKDQLEVEKTD